MSDLRKLWLLLQLRRNCWRKTEDLLQVQEKKLRMLLKHAYANVEYYHRKFDSVRLKPDDIRCAEDLRKLPMTTKEEVHKNSPKITARNIDLNKCATYSTAGSTGVPTTTLVDPKGNDFRAAVFGRPFLECGLGIRDKMMFVGDARHFPTRQQWFMRLGFLTRAYLSAAESAERHLPRILEYEPDAFFSYSSFLIELAKAVQQSNTKISPKLVFSTAEVLSDNGRQLIESNLETEVFDLYGCSEAERLAWECEEHMGYHMDIDSDVIEFVEDDEAVTSDEEGKIVVTCLFNYAMPLIRYEVGDIGVPSNEKCSCGRGLPLMKKILGRQDDLIITPNGRVIIPLAITSIMRGVPGIKQFRIVQESIDKLAIKIVKDEEFSDETLEKLAEEVRNFVQQDMLVEFSTVDSIEKDKSGKIRAVISYVKPTM